MIPSRDECLRKSEPAGSGGRSGSQVDSDKIEEAWTRLYETLVRFRLSRQEDATPAGIFFIDV
jgi:hypothetical protein